MLGESPPRVQEIMQTINPDSYRRASGRLKMNFEITGENPRSLHVKSVIIHSSPTRPDEILHNNMDL